MPRGPRVDNDELLSAGLDLMKQNGKPLKKRTGFGRSMFYDSPNGETVRVRTCNDHILIVLSDQHSGDATLNIEGTDWLLIVMPEIERTPGKVRAYLVPTSVACDAVRRTHQAWLDTSPNTKGSNTTWNVWFSAYGPAKANNFEAHWKQYLLPGNADTTNIASESDASDSSVRTEVETARMRISKAAGVPPSAVKISIDFAI